MYRGLLILRYDMYTYVNERRCPVEMTDKQMEFFAKLIADKFRNCKTMEEVKQAAEEITKMASIGNGS